MEIKAVFPQPYHGAAPSNEQKIISLRCVTMKCSHDAATSVLRTFMKPVKWRGFISIPIENQADSGGWSYGVARLTNMQFLRSSAFTSRNVMT